MDHFSHSHHPIDDIEPNEINLTQREADQLLGLLNWSIEFVANAQNTRLAIWQVAYATGSLLCIKSMSEKGRELGLGHAAISKGAREFCETYGLPPSKWMKSEKFVEKRRKQATPKD